MKDAWYKTTLKSTELGVSLKLDVPHDVFSTHQIDEGTILLLQNLPSKKPKRVLDMGCGYGALSLPIAAQFRDAVFDLVDRDLLAVRWAKENAKANHLQNVDAYGSLGFRNVKKHDQAFDWILCNIPARIGRNFIEDFFKSGLTLIAEAGEIRVVVINDLVPVLNEIKYQCHLPIIEVVRGPRHSVYALTAVQDLKSSKMHDLYFRDQVELGELTLDRPFDLGGDDPKRLKVGLPILIDALPRQFSKGKILCFRCGYGQLPLISCARWPEASVIAVDRDLLATTFTRRNAEKLNFMGIKLEIRENHSFIDSILPGEKFDLILGELSPSAGEAVAIAELNAITQSLNRGANALILNLEKLDRQWVKPWVEKNKQPVNPLIQREGYVVRSIRGL